MSANARMENSGPPRNGEGKGRKAAERVVLWIAVPCVLAMGVWRFILPWTGERTDLIFKVLPPEGQGFGAKFKAIWCYYIPID